MMNVIGQRKVLVILMLVLLNAAMAYGLYMHVSPQMEVKERAFRTLKARQSSLEKDIEGLTVQMADLEIQKVTFAALEKKKFFDDQNRRRAATMLKSIQNRAGVINAIVKLGGGQVIENESAAKIKHKVVSSLITVEISALDDRAIYKYLEILQEQMPGVISVEKLVMRRKANITGTILRGIASGQMAPLAGASLEVRWITLVPEGNVVLSETDGGAVNASVGGGT